MGEFLPLMDFAYFIALPNICLKFTIESNKHGKQMWSHKLELEILLVYTYNNLV